MATPPHSPPELKPDDHGKCWTNTLASFMGRHIRHAHARSSEWIRVHRGPSGNNNHGGGGGGEWPAFIVGAVIIGIGLWWLLKWLLELLLSVLPMLIVLVVIGAVFGGGKRRR